jgi:tetratricopeptide (TPR) repeat protein
MYKLRAFSCGVALVCALQPVGVRGAQIDQAQTLQREGRLQEARDLLQAAIRTSRASGDRSGLVKALSASSRISVSVGNYTAAIKDAEEVIRLRRNQSGRTSLADDFNTLGLAHQYLGKYDEALEHYQSALREDLQYNDAEGEITRLNNIGNIFYFQGRYSDALRSYQAALQRVNATANESWNPWRRQLTTANLATLDQRLGREQKALDLYRQLSISNHAMPASEQAQVLLNEGVLYRRLGDPIKSLELYGIAQLLFRKQNHSDGQIGALRNIGIVRTVDLDDLAGALDTFTAALKLAQNSLNRRGTVQNSLYRAEVLRRLGRIEEAEEDLHTALDIAQKSGLIEEKWKALYTLGQIAEDGGHAGLARERYERAIDLIESVRSGLRQPALKTDFLADKRNVYDSLIRLKLRDSNPSPAALLKWIERTRARTLLERLATKFGLGGANLQKIQAKLPSDAALVEYWIGSRTGAAVWITASAAGIKRFDDTDHIGSRALRLQAALQSGSDDR